SSKTSSSAASPITSHTTTGSGGASFATSGNPNSSSTQYLSTGTGTNILQSGWGADRFTVDPSVTGGWAEIDNMHSGDVVNILNFRQGQSTITWTNSTDPAGHSGATANISLNGDGHTNVAVTFAGASVAQAQGFSSGEWHTSSGTPYLSIWKV
nr:hypothetical protein [Rhodospirillales bacterium]